MTLAGAPVNSQPSSAARRMLAMRKTDTAALSRNSSASYQGTRLSGALAVPGNTRNTKGSDTSSRP